MHTLEEIKRDSLAGEVPIIFDGTAAALTRCLEDHKPRAVLEIGGGMGYSGRIILNAAKPKKFVSIEKDPNRHAYLTEVIAPHCAVCGDAFEIMQGLQRTGEKFDFVFLDGPKGQYGRYFELIDGLLAQNGVIFADNMDFHGMVDGRIPTTVGARSIVNGLKSFTDKVNANGYSVTKLADGDGIVIAVKGGNMVH